MLDALRFVGLIFYSSVTYVLVGQNHWHGVNIVCGIKKAKLLQIILGQRTQELHSPKAFL